MLHGAGGLRVNCGDTPIDACIAAAQPLIDAVGGGDAGR